MHGGLKAESNFINGSVPIVPVYLTQRTSYFYNAAIY